MPTQQAKHTAGQQKLLGRVIAKAWADPAFIGRLKANPRDVLAEMGIETEKNVEIQVVENTADMVYLVLPAAPPQALLNDEQIATTVSLRSGLARTILTYGFDCCKSSHTEHSGGRSI